MDDEIKDEIEKYREKFGRRVDEFFGGIFKEVMASGDPNTVAYFVMQLNQAAKLVRAEVQKAGILLPVEMPGPSEN